MPQWRAYSRDIPLVACTRMFERRDARNYLATAFVLPLVLCLCEGRGGTHVPDYAAFLIPGPR
jgi:hypothetical protein